MQIVLRDILLKESQGLKWIDIVYKKANYKAEEGITQPYHMTLETILSFMAQKVKKIKFKVIELLLHKDKNKRQSLKLK